MEKERTPKRKDTPRKTVDSARKKKRQGDNVRSATDASKAPKVGRLDFDTPPSVINDSGDAESESMSKGLLSALTNSARSALAAAKSAWREIRPVENPAAVLAVIRTEDQPMVDAVALSRDLEETWLPAPREDAGEKKPTDELYWVLFWEGSCVISPLPGALSMICAAPGGCPAGTQSYMVGSLASSRKLLERVGAELKDPNKRAELLGVLVTVAAQMMMLRAHIITKHEEALLPQQITRTNSPASIEYRLRSERILYHVFQYDSAKFAYLRTFFEDVAFYDGGVGRGVRAYSEAIWNGLVQRNNATAGAKVKLPTLEQLFAA